MSPGRPALALLLLFGCALLALSGGARAQPSGDGWSLGMTVPADGYAEFVLPSSPSLFEVATCYPASGCLPPELGSASASWGAAGQDFFGGTGPTEVSIWFRGVPDVPPPEPPASAASAAVWSAGDSENLQTAANASRALVGASLVLTFLVSFVVGLRS